MQKEIITAITILMLVGFFGMGYYFGQKDSFPISCFNQGKTAVIIGDKQICISQNFTYDVCQPKFSDYLLDMEINYGIKPN